MKYKMVVKAGDKVFVKARSKSKEHLENRAIALTKKKPYITVYVVSEDTRIQCVYDGAELGIDRRVEMRVDYRGGLRYSAN